MKAKLAIFLVCLLIFVGGFNFLTRMVVKVNVSAQEPIGPGEPGDPVGPGDTGGWGGGDEPIPPPIVLPTMGEGDTTPQIISCDGAYCWKCSFDEDNPSESVDMPSTPMECDEDEIALLEADGWHCPWAHMETALFEAAMEQMEGDGRSYLSFIEMLQNMLLTASYDLDVMRVFYEQEYKWLFACSGRTYICDDSKPWPNKCKELNCDVYGQCEWDAEINHCYSPEAYADQDVPDIGITPVPIELNRAVCWDCKKEEETLARCWPWPSFCSVSRNETWNPRDDYMYGVVRALMPSQVLGDYYISDCGVSYPMCQSPYWDYDVQGDFLAFIGRKKVNFCERDCKESIGIFPPGVGCFGGDPVYYGCENYPSDDDLPDDDESAMCRKVTEDQSPTCGFDGTCWTWPECNATCQGFYYCNSEITPVCQLGYYKDLEDCETKNDGGCYETRLGCLSNCDCGENGCGPTLNEPPKIEIGDGGMNPAVNIPGDGRFHICDSDFWIDSVNAPHQAYFKVKIDHSESAQKIDVIALGFNHVENGEVVYDLWLPVIGLSENSGSGPGILSVQEEESDKVEVMSITEDLSESPNETTRTMTYLITYDDDFPINLNNIWVAAMDDVGRTLWTYTDASFKFWDCNVDFEGKLYDDSEMEEDLTCPTNGWETEATDTVNFNSLYFDNIGVTVVANIIDNNSFSGSGLMWSKTYSSNFNSDINCDITSVVARSIDIGSVGTTSCMEGSIIDTTEDNDLLVPKYTIDPFVDDPRVQLDYSIAQFADPWYQISGGDLRALGNIGNYVRSPMQMVVDSGGNDAGWIAAGGSFSAGNNDNYSASGWMTENQSGIFGTRFGYDYLYSELKLKKGIGTTAVNWSGIGDTGVYFIDGNLTIDSNNMALAAGGYRVIVVDGDINIDAAVSNLYGVFIADGNINVTGNSATDAQLIIKGMMYSKGNIVMSRGFDTTSLNNSQAATVIDFDPNLIFNMPPAVFKVMSDWRQGPR